MKIQKELLLSRTICSLALEIQNITDRMLKPHNITMEQLWVLRCLSVNNAKLTQRELCQKSSKTPANITRIIDRLENKSFVVRLVSPDDRRSCLVTLTVRGRALIRETDHVLESFSCQFSSGIDPESLNTTKQALDSMNSNLSKMSKALKQKGKLFYEDSGDEG